ncbi:sulfur carrier protein ThiS [Actinophytocola oryzae]|uniref:Sulfur carrier protein n=1 Tax=Actinophytocola oryzae TaxID=502181 RepID=A0A4R7V091_9PSEU|nr:sulfur carrier protein ThiS [Actinophytocola oryzae]TDV40786.1 sulfur carrier protein [Actinophytocola oryzae]
MYVQVNGSEREVPDGATVTELLEALGVPARGVAVAVDGAVVTRADHDRTVVLEGAEVEVLTAVQGG